MVKEGQIFRSRAWRFGHGWVYQKHRHIVLLSMVAKHTRSANGENLIKIVSFSAPSYKNDSRNYVILAVNIVHNAFHAVPGNAMPHEKSMTFSQMHRRKRQNLGPFHLSQFRSNHSIQSCSNRFSSLVDQHTSIVIEFNHAAIWALQLLDCPYDNRMPDISTSYFVRR